MKPQDLLLPISFFYKTLWKLEYTFFKTFPFLVHKMSAKVVSVGNITMGGTGKTPILLQLLNELTLQGSVVLTRGYKSAWERSFYLVSGNETHPSELTDETLLVHSYFPEVPIFLGKNRFHAAKLAEKWFSPRIVLLDDGFQYRRLKKKFDLVLWDATIDPKKARLIPAGVLREPLERFREASAILLTRVESVSSSVLADRHDFFHYFSPMIPVIEISTHATGWIDPSGQRIPLENGPKEAVVFAGIGRTDSFEILLRKLNLNIKDRKWYRDHHRFSKADFEDLMMIRKDSPLVCTEKDRVKIPPSLCKDLQLFSLRIQMKPHTGRSLLAALKEVSIDLEF